ncbi:MAG TPA: 50S ribosomal protein L23 [Acidobacteriota bacterium]|jgi:large subunit ribosomal protein L23
MNNNYKVILKPLITEKSTRLKEQHRQLCFLVDRAANRIDVKRAVEALFKVKVEAVRIVNQGGKLKRFGRSSGYRPDRKKAYVVLKPGSKTIEYFEGV